ncbi:hypothetical protein CF327_g5136 [Tilletia walkeri]|uniref:NmrA-like domain-containing protein n=1 Tax=Tilletia walkeri TaxID=117179 RepID=A0A8X7N4H0_9BASI|nr:hypothetical protein CF327_g5136 [Tilletia walkeri]KAE8265209.1 hypothetical protein A4X09_0g6721 [Tilletia walkeri]
MASRQVALCGGFSSRFGRKVHEALLGEQALRVVSISRKEIPELQGRAYAQHVVDYSDINSLASALQGCDTVISLIWSTEGMLESQRTLLRAAEQAGSVRRFIGSEWGVDTTRSRTVPHYDDKVTFYTDYLSKSSIEQPSVVFDGLFMDYFSAGEGKFMPVKIGGLTAKIPGTGDEQVSMTRMEDVADLVRRLLLRAESLPPVVRGQATTTTWNKMVNDVQTLVQRTFSVKHVSLAELEADCDRGDNSMGSFMKHVNCLYAKGEAEIQDENARELVPDWKPMTLAEFLQKNYGPGTEGRKALDSAENL